MKRWGFLIGILGIVLSPAVARGATADTARQVLIHAQISPRPLYPTVLPDPLNDESQATITHGRHGFTVTYLCKCDPVDSSYYSVILTFSRGSANDLSKLIGFVKHVERNPVRRVRIDGINMYKFYEDVRFGYGWRSGRYSYIVTDHDSDQASWNFVHQVIDWLSPLGREWTGRTSQGQWVSLYSSRLGIDYDIHATLGCDDGSGFPDFEEGVVDPKPDGSFITHQAYGYTDGSGDTHSEAYDFAGRLGAAGAGPTGVFSVTDTDSDTQVGCRSGFVGWQTR